ncbi:hypothetical protein HN011_004209 [Eciton burchellii]|nr:hypothetical protein HN011_004209 [Eciton burchellii]
MIDICFRPPFRLSKTQFTLMLFDNDNIYELRETRDQLISLMKRGDFQLWKWAANSPNLPEDSNSQHNLVDHLLAKNETLKILRLSWLPQEDIFYFVITPSVAITPTRRSILSFIAKLYDPLGWAAPICSYCCEDFVPETVVAQRQLGCFNTARVGATLDGIR